ncbi:MAG: PEP-CTERM sorting domain-containing protein [Planctomycetes bacterium]|nr:PEP-CTERM sorting domain-containing protein [Planctomycetota bacterium]MCG2684163.1 PEP-CTERM sorting domain-containing protein [Planctomycetales bacterium]
MSRNFASLLLVSFLAVTVTVGFTNVAWATIIQSPVTGDADSGINSLYPYTHTIDTGTNIARTINSVTFTPAGEPAPGDITGTSSQGFGWSGTGFIQQVRVASGWLPGSGATVDMINDINTRGGSTTVPTTLTVTLAGLTPGGSYVFDSYSVGASGVGGIRSITMTNSANADTDTFFMDAYEFPVKGNLVSYAYTAVGDNITFTFTAPANTGSYSFNLSGFTNRIPEPGTLALLATGLIGLLCYAWRKRK